MSPRLQQSYWSVAVIYDNKPHDCLVQKCYIDLFLECVVISMWGESEFCFCGESCNDAFVNHLIVLTSPCSMSALVMNLSNTVLSFSQEILLYCSTIAKF